MSQPIQTLGVAVAPDRLTIWEKAELLCQRVRAAGRRVLLAPQQAAAATAAGQQACEVVELPRLAEADMVATLGGDGTLLAAVRHAAPCRTPVLGVNLGSLGFLAWEGFEAVLQGLESLLDGGYEVEERLMVSAQVVSGDVGRREEHGLNEAVIARADPRHPAWLNVRINGEEIAAYPADGLIVSTPTGSTAYALSAGGPILPPSLEALVLIPICPHTLNARPLVVEPTATIEVSTIRRGQPTGDLRLTLDGQITLRVEPGQRIVLRRSSLRARLARISTAGFYQRLRAKLGWGGGGMEPGDANRRG